MNNDSSSSQSDALIELSPIPSVIYRSGSTVCQEALWNGRWVGWAWSTTGKVQEIQQLVNTPDAARHILPVPSAQHLALQAFELEIDGQSLHHDWEWVAAHEERDEKGQSHTVVRLRHQVRPVELAIHTMSDGTSFFRRWLEITNTGTAIAALGRVLPWCSLLWRTRTAFAWNDIRQLAGTEALTPFTLGHYASDTHLWEGEFVWSALPGHKVGLASIQGKSGWGLPFFALRNDVTGEMCLAHLAWSGNWEAEVRPDLDSAAQEALCYFGIGPQAQSPQRLIAPGETIVTPAVHLGFLHPHDFDEGVQTLHAHLRKSVFRTLAPEKQLLIGAGRVVNDNPDWLRQEIEMAAEAEMEYFVVDALWYGSNPNWWDGTTGDWTPGYWMPGGLAPVREFIHSKGMLFGLWMEPEAIGVDAQLRKDHPEWVLQRDGGPLGERRALNLGLPEVAEFVEREIIRVITEYQVDIFKLDYNFNVFEGGYNRRDGYSESEMWRHYEVLYHIFDRVRQECPQVIMENCAGGGGRNDVGMLSRFDVCSMSDWTALPRVLQELYGMTVALPPAVLRHYFDHIGAESPYYGDLTTQLRVALFSNPLFVGFAAKPDYWGADRKNEVLRHVRLYKDFCRKILPNCLTYHHTPFQRFNRPQTWCVLEVAAADRSAGYAGVFRLTGDGGEEYTLKPRGLSPGTTYQVSLDNHNDSYTATGYELTRNGIPIRLAHAVTSELVLFKKL